MAAGFIFFHFRELQGKCVIFQQGNLSILPAYYREGFTPISLAAKEPVSNFVIDGPRTQLVLLQPFYGGCDSLFFGLPVDVQAGLF